MSAGSKDTRGLSFEILWLWADIGGAVALSYGPWVRIAWMSVSDPLSLGVFSIGHSRLPIELKDLSILLSVI